MEIFDQLSDRDIWEEFIEYKKTAQHLKGDEFDTIEGVSLYRQRKISRGSRKVIRRQLRTSNPQTVCHKQDRREEEDGLHLSR